MVSYEGYVHVPVCKDAVLDETIFNNFKKDVNFTTILEHTSSYNSHIFLNNAIKKYGEYMKKINWKNIMKNDSVGNASLERYDELSAIVTLDNYLFSPSTIAYVFKALDILNHMKESSITNARILEIGGGYGGQAKTIYDIHELFGITIDSYTIVDLHWPTKLQQKYLQNLGYNDVNFIAYEKLSNGKKEFPKDFNYVISIYALSEFDNDVKDFYMNKLSNMDKYYILWNIGEIHNFFLDSDIVEENPKTGPHNVLIKSKA